MHIANNAYSCVIYNSEEQTYGCGKSNIHHVACLKVPNVPGYVIVLKPIHLHVVSKSSNVETESVNT